jgi:hypothetical protein
VGLRFTLPTSLRHQDYAELARRYLTVSTVSGRADVAVEAYTSTRMARSAETDAPGSNLTLPYDILIYT